MGAFTRLLAEVSETEKRYPPWHEFWYSPTGSVSSSGMTVNAETAQKLSAWWRALFILSTAGVASVPCIVYRRLANGGRERAPGMPIFDIVHTAPNSWQTAPEYWDFRTRCLIQSGNAYSLIVPGPRGPVDQLIPMHPDRMRVIELEGNQIVYSYRGRDGVTRTYSQEEIFHTRVFSEDGKTGRSLLSYAANSLGHALALDSYSARLFKNAPMMAGILSCPTELTDEAFDRMRRSFKEAYSGPEGWHSVAVLEKGTTWEALGMTNKDAQLLEAREFGIREIARWTGVKKYLLESEQTPSYNSIEAFQIEHVVYAIRPWTYAMEQSIDRDLIMASGTYYAEFLLDALLRGDPLRQAEKLNIERQNGVVSANEWRELQNRNRRADAGGDEYWTQPNLAREAAGVRAEQIARATAGRIVRREIAAIRKAAGRYAESPVDWDKWVREFYERHAAFVSDALALSPMEAERYCTTQRGRLETYGIGTIHDWEFEVPAALAAVALATVA